MSFYQKYLKYKQKYLDLKNEFKNYGGTVDMTTLENKYPNIDFYEYDDTSINWAKWLLKNLHVIKRGDHLRIDDIYKDSVNYDINSISNPIGYFMVYTDNNHKKYCGIITNIQISNPIPPVVNTTQPMISTTQPMISTIQPMISTTQPMISTTQPLINNSIISTNNAQQPIDTSNPINISGGEGEEIDITQQPLSNNISIVDSTQQPLSNTIQPVNYTQQNLINNTTQIPITPQPVISKNVNITKHKYKYYDLFFSDNFNYSLNIDGTRNLFCNEVNCTIKIPSNSEIILIKEFIAPELANKSIYKIKSNPLTYAYPPSVEPLDEDQYMSDQNDDGSDYSQNDGTDNGSDNSQNDGTDNGSDNSQN